MENQKRHRARELESLRKLACFFNALGEVIRIDEVHGRRDDFSNNRHRLFFYDTEQAEDAVQVVVAVILDRDVAFFVAVLDRDARGEAMREEILHALDGGGGFLRAVFGAAFAGLAAFLHELRGEFFGNTHRMARANDLLGEEFLLLLISEREQDLRVADRDAAVFE